MDGSDLCFEIVNRVNAGFVFSEAVARYRNIKYILKCVEQLLNEWEVSLYLHTL
jgi:hypothetical protein